MDFEIDSIKLITLVKNHKELYDRNANGYKNTVMRARLWHKIANQLKTTDTECLKKWKSLRDKMRREIHKTEAADASGVGISTGKWELFDCMYFLVEHTKPKRTDDIKREFEKVDISNSNSETYLENEHNDDDLFTFEDQLEEDHIEEEMIEEHGAIILTKDEDFQSSKKRKYDMSDITYDFKQAVTSITNLVKEKQQTKSKHADFLTSVTAMLDSLHSQNQEMAKSKILSFLVKTQMVQNGGVIDQRIDNLWTKFKDDLNVLFLDV